MDSLAHTLSSCPWGGLEPASIVFCERRLCGWLVEPSNTWSNIGFLIVGFLILYRSKKHNQELGMIGVTAILVGIGSTLFHATASRIGEILDVSAMYFISALFITFYLKRIFNFSRTSLVLLFLGISGSAIAALIATGSNGIRLFAAHLVVCALLEVYGRVKLPRNVNYKYLRLMVGFFALSYTVWLLDIKHIICDPDNHVLGGHALWHLGNAASLWCYYNYQKQFYPTLDS